MGPPLLDVRHLTTVFETGRGPVRAVDGVSLTVGPGETVGLAGESGSGKSAIALSVLRLVQPPGRITGGEVLFEGRNLLALDEAAMRRIRGGSIGLIFQEPASALNPVFTVGDHFAETFAAHRLGSRAAARACAAALLDAVRVPEARRRVDDYPHQLSGGLRQRVLIALALACRPRLLVADEPTTALDVSVQADVLDLLRDVRASFGLSLLLVTHDLEVIAGQADRVAVMYAGRVVEQGPVGPVFDAPAHPYTRALLAASTREVVHGRLRAIQGTVPDLLTLPPGCAFAPRCPDRSAICEAAAPPAAVVGGREVRCHLHVPGACEAAVLAASPSTGGGRPAQPLGQGEPC